VKYYLRILLIVLSLVSVAEALLLKRIYDYSELQDGIVSDQWDQLKKCK